MLKENLL